MKGVEDVSAVQLQLLGQERDRHRDTEREREREKERDEERERKREIQRERHKQREGVRDKDDAELAEDKADKAALCCAHQGAKK